MRLFGVSQDGDFAEYLRTGFGNEHQEAVLEDWLEKNPDGIVQDSKLLMIGRQIQTSLGKAIDLLALDRQGDLVVIELKRGRTPRETIAQALESAAYTAQLAYAQIEGVARQYHDDDALSLAQVHREYFALTPEEGASFNKNQRIVVVGETITREIRETATFLNDNGLRVTCLEFAFFRTDDGKGLLSGDIVVTNDARDEGPVASGARGPKTTEKHFMKSLDSNGALVFSKVFALAQERSLPISWGAKGFSINVDFNGVRCRFCYGYPPQAVYGQSLYTRMFDNFLARVNSGETVARELATDAKVTGLFVPAGNEFKCPITRALTDKEVDALLTWIGTAADRIEKAGLREDSADDETERSNNGIEPIP